MTEEQKKAIDAIITVIQSIVSELHGNTISTDVASRYINQLEDARKAVQ